MSCGLSAFCPRYPLLSCGLSTDRYQAGLRDEYWGVERLEFVVGLVAALRACPRSSGLATFCGAECRWQVSDGDAVVARFAESIIAVSIYSSSSWLHVLSVS